MREEEINGSEAKREATACLRTLHEKPSSQGQLLAVLYEELRAQAAGLLRRERPNHTLQATALVHEAWLRLIDPQAVRAGDRNTFLMLASQAMRRVLIDHARVRGREKRGGAALRVELDESLECQDRSHSILEIDDALTRLSARSAQLGKLVELRFFGGLSREEAAEVLGISQPTATRIWRLARAELTRLLGESLV